MFWQAALFYHRGLEMITKQCKVWSPMCTNSSSFNKANCKSYLGQDWKKISVGFHVRITSFHMKISSFHMKIITKDNLPGMVTPMFSFFFLHINFPSRSRVLGVGVLPSLPIPAPKIGDHHHGFDYGINHLAGLVTIYAYSALPFMSLVLIPLSCSFQRGRSNLCITQTYPQLSFLKFYLQYHRSYIFATVWQGLIYCFASVFSMALSRI